MPDVSELTLFFKWTISQWFPDPCLGDDLVFRETLVKVANEILLRLEQTHDKLSSQDLEVIAFALRRVYFIAQAYTNERKTFTVAQWTTQLIDALKSVGVSGLSEMI